MGEAGQRFDSRLVAASESHQLIAHVSVEEEKMEDRKREVEKQIYKLRKELNYITDKESEVENKKFVGRYFKTRNNFSCPEKPSDYWWLYLHVLGIKDSDLHVLQFQTDKDGRIEIIPDRFYMARSLERYEEIKESEYVRAWNKLIDKINNFKD